jgi:hypothetical protein
VKKNEKKKLLQNLKKLSKNLSLDDIMPQRHTKESIEIIDGDAFEDDEDEDDDKDDWSAVPAFLRRKK